MQLFPTIFREKALARRAEREAVDARLQVTAPHEWLVVSGLGVALLVLLAYGVLGQAERSLTVDAVLVQPGERVDVVAGVSGVVASVFAKAGDAVKAGQVIARVRQAGGEQDIVASHAGELAALALAAGRRVAAGDLAARIRTASAGPVEALGFIAREDALRLAPGMQAQMLVAVPGGGAPRLLPARVEEISARAASAPPWLAEFGVEPPPRAHLLRATVTGPATQSVADGVQGELRIILDRRSFASLLFGNDGG